MTGRFVWHDLLTTDVEAAIAFYGEVAGYKTEIFTDSPAPTPYRMWVTAQGPLGGVMKMPDGADGPCAPPFWTGYVDVDDIEQTMTRVTQLGGKVFKPPTLIPKVGRFGVIGDPQGASISVLEPLPPEQPMPERDKSKQGEIVWNELHARDANSALAFYGELFGWSLQEELDMGPAGKYLIYGQGSQSYGGMMSDASAPPSWIYYIQVDELESAIGRAVELGAKKTYGPAPVPGGTRIASLIDPQGATFALHGK